MGVLELLWGYLLPAAGTCICMGKSAVSCHLYDSKFFKTEISILQFGLNLLAAFSHPVFFIYGCFSLLVLLCIITVKFLVQENLLVSFLLISSSLFTNGAAGIILC